MFLCKTTLRFCADIQLFAGFFLKFIANFKNVKSLLHGRVLIVVWKTKSPFVVFDNSNFKVWQWFRALKENFS